MEKNNQREVGEERKSNLFFYVTHQLNLIHSAIKFHQDIPYSYIVMVGTYKDSQKINQREVTQKLKKGEQSVYATHSLNFIHIAIKFHQDIQYGHLIVACII